MSNYLNTMNGFSIPEIIISSPWEVEELIGNSLNSTKPPCNESISRRLKQKLLKNKLAKSNNITTTPSSVSNSDTQEIKVINKDDFSHTNKSSNEIVVTNGKASTAAQNHIEMCSNPNLNPQLTSFGFRKKHKINDSNERSLDADNNNNNNNINNNSNNNIDNKRSTYEKQCENVTSHHFTHNTNHYTYQTNALRGENCSSSTKRVKLDLQ